MVLVGSHGQLAALPPARSQLQQHGNNSHPPRYVGHGTSERHTLSVRAVPRRAARSGRADRMAVGKGKRRAGVQRKHHKKHPRAEHECAPAAVTKGSAVPPREAAWAHSSLPIADVQAKMRIHTSRPQILGRLEHCSCSCQAQHSVLTPRVPPSHHRQPTLSCSAHPILAPHIHNPTGRADLEIKPLRLCSKPNRSIWRGRSSSFS